MMTTEIEKQFFIVFEIPKIFKTTINTGDLDLNYVEIQAPTLKELYEKAQYDFNTPIYFSWFKRSKRWREEYPEITDRILLELICLLNSVSVECKSECIEDLKREILGEAIILFEYAPNEETAEFIKHQVRTLFKEG